MTLQSHVKASPLDTNPHTNVALYTSSVPISGSQSLFCAPVGSSVIWPSRAMLKPHHLTPIHIPMLLSIRLLSQSVAHNPFSVPLSAPVSYDSPEPCKSLTTWHQSTYQCCSLYISCPNQWLTIPFLCPCRLQCHMTLQSHVKASPLDTNPHINVALYTSPVPISGSQSLFCAPVGCSVIWPSRAM